MTYDFTFVLSVVTAVAAIIAAVAALQTAYWQKRQTLAAAERPAPVIKTAIAATPVKDLYRLQIVLREGDFPATVVGYAVRRPWSARLLLIGSVAHADAYGNYTLDDAPALHLARRTVMIPDTRDGAHGWNRGGVYVHCPPSPFSGQGSHISMIVFFSWSDLMNRRRSISITIKLPIVTQLAPSAMI